MDRTAFRVQFPEFVNVANDQIDAFLVAAALEVDAGIFDGAKYDQAQGYLCAHRLCCSPFGQNARMINKEGRTTYLEVFEKLQRQVTFGYRVC